MKFIIRWVYKLFGVYTRIYIMDGQYNIIKPNIKLTFIPHSNDLIYFDSVNNYFMVIKVIHKISDRHEIWIVVEQFTDDNKKFVKKIINT